MKQHVFVHGNISASQYTLHIVLTKETGSVQFASCNCKAGLSGVCSHVGGLLFTVVKIKNPCTSRECEWQRPRTISNPPSPKRLQDIRFVKTDNDACSHETPTVKPYPGVYQAGQCNDPDNFLKEILQGLQLTHSSSVLYQTLSWNSLDISHIMERYEPAFMYLNHVDLESYVCQSILLDHTNTLEVSREEADLVCKATRGQSHNKIWKKTRTYLLTASNFGILCKKKDTTLPDNLIKLLRAYKDLPVHKIPSIHHGQKYEAKARRCYAKKHLKTCGGNVSVKDMGLYISSKYPFLGASLDGIITCSKCGVGTLEIKCPYGKKSDIWRNKHPRECASNKGFCAQIDEKKKTLILKMDHNYYYQVIGQLAILELDWCDFVIWTKKGMTVQRILFNQPFWESKMMYKLKISTQMHLLQNFIRYE